MKNVIFTVYFINKWYDKDDEKHKSDRINELRKKVRLGFKDYNKRYRTKDTNAFVEVRGLRASAGNIVFDSIYKKMLRANALIVDITPDESKDMRNIWFELGIALSLAKMNENLKVFLLCHKKDKKTNLDLKEILPSDLHGYFVTPYYYAPLNTGNKITYDDQKSFISSLHFMAQEFFRNHELNVGEISEEELNKLN